MKRMGVLGGMSAQATMDFEARVHRVAQRLIPQNRSHGYPPMVVWYHRGGPLRMGADGRPLVPREVDPGLIEAARWLGKSVDFIVMTCNAAHVGIDAIREAAACPVLSMIDLAVEDAVRRGCRRVGVTGFAGAPAVYTDALKARGIDHAGIAEALQPALDAGIHAVAEGREGARDTGAARAAVAALRGAAVDGIVMGCTEIPLLLGDDSIGADLINPLELLAEAAVKFAISER